MSSFRQFISLAIVIIILAALMIPGIPLVSLPVHAQYCTSWWDSNWQYRIPVTITEYSGANLTNYQVKVTLNTSNFDYSDVLGSNGSDLRFVTSGGTELEYWIETWNTSGQSTIWLEAPSLIANTATTVYLYYGKTGASAVSDGNTTFNFFDDFSDDLSKWGSPIVAAGNGTATWQIESGELSGNVSAGLCSHFITDSFSIQNGVFEWRMKSYATGSDKDRAGLVRYQDSNNLYAAGWEMTIGSANTTQLVKIVSGNITALDSANDTAVDTDWHDYAFLFNASTLKFYIDGSETLSATNSDLLSAGKAGFDLENVHAYFDNVRVRQYVSPEPTASLGNDDPYTSDAWWNSSWPYRTDFEIRETSGANLTNYPIEITLNTTTFNYNRVEGTSGEDIRFAASNGTEWDYWIETWNSSGESTIWIEAPSMTAYSHITVYMYYGKTGENAGSDRMATFPLHDDFEDETFDTRWAWDKEPGNEHTGGGWDEGSTTAGRLRMTSDKNTNNCGVLENAQGCYQLVSGNFEFELVTYGNPGQATEQSGITVLQDVDNLIKVGYGNFISDCPAVYKQVNNVCTGLWSVVNSSSPKYFKIKRTGNSWQAWYHNAGTSVWTNMTTWTQVLTDPLMVGFGVADGASAPHSNYTVTFDYVLGRYYASSEPIVTMGHEESTFSWSDYFGNTTCISSNNTVIFSNASWTFDMTSNKLIIYPTSNYNINIPNLVGAATHWAAVDDPAGQCDNADTYVSIGNNVNWFNDLYGHDFDNDDYPDGNVTRVKAIATCDLFLGGAYWAKPLFYDGALRTGSTWWVNYNWGTDSQDITSLRASWSWDDIRDGYFGISLRSAILNACGCSQIYLEVAYSLTGNITSTGIYPGNITNWDIFAWDDSEPTDTDIKYQIEYCSGGSWQLIPDSDLSGNSAGFDNSPVQLEHLDVSTYRQLRLRANLSTSDPDIAPSLNSWRVTWNDWRDGWTGWDKIDTSTNLSIGADDVTVDLYGNNTVIIYPSGDSSITIPQPGAGTHWDDVSDANNTTEVSTGTCVGTGWYNDLYTNSFDAGDYPNGNITIVTIYAKCAADGTAYAGAKPLFHDGTLHTGTAWTIAGNSSWTSYSQNITSFRESWAWSDITNCTFGISLKGGACSNAASCTQIYLEVRYTTPGSFTSLPATPYNHYMWSMFYSNHTLPSGTDINYEIINAYSNATLCTITADQAAGGYDLTLCAGNVSSIKVYAELQAYYDTPILHAYRITWISLPSEPTIAGVSLYDSDRINQICAGQSINPQIEYSLKVTVVNPDTLDDITEIKNTLFYDSNGNDTSAPDTGNTFNCAIITWTKGSGWSISPSANTTWILVSGNCSIPTMSHLSGHWWANFKPGKVATASGTTDDWDMYTQITNTDLDTYNKYSRDYDMNWYGEITVNTNNINWGNVSTNSDFSDNVQSGISISYISNGNYNKQVKASSPWGNATTLSVDESGNPGDGAFSLKAANGTALGNATLISSAGYTTFGTGNQTTETLITEGNNTLWLKMGYGAMRAIYTGTIFYQISDN